MRNQGDWFNSGAHLLGAVAAVAGLVALLVIAGRQGDPWKIVSFSIYGGTLILLYTFSSLYHALRGRPRSIFHRLDHCAIYLLIAGTYTPLTLVSLRGGWGWTLFGINWGLTLLGIVYESFPHRGRRILPVVIYLTMGWLIIIAWGPLSKALPAEGIAWLVAGGLFYTGGVLFYALDSLWAHFHCLWHLFVLAGSISHYVAVLRFVA